MKHRIIKSFVILVQIILCSSCTNKQIITDKIGVLSESTTKSIDTLVSQYEKESTCDIRVYIDSSIPKKDNIDSYSLKLFNRLGVGKKNVNNGVLIFIAMNDRKIRLQLGYGMEWLIQQGSADSIVDEMVKNFKKGEFGIGIYESVKHIIKETQSYTWYVKPFDDDHIQRNDIVKLENFNFVKDIEPYTIIVKKKSAFIKLHYTKFMSNLIVSLKKANFDANIYYRTITNTKDEGNIVGIN